MNKHKHVEHVTAFVSRLLTIDCYTIDSAPAVTMNRNSLLLLLLNVIYEKQLPEVVIPSEIITQFANHNSLFHFENCTKPIVDVLFTKIPHNTSYLMINYDLVPPSCNLTERPTGHQFLHVVLLRNSSNLNRYTKYSVYSIEYVDLLLFLNFNDIEFQFWRGNILEKAGGLFIYNTKNLTLHTVCFFCGNLTGLLQTVDKFSISSDNQQILIPKLNKYINKFDDFNKHVFGIGYNIYKPLFFGKIVEQTGNHSIYNGQGIEKELLMIMSEKLNFICLMIPFFTYKNSWAAVVNAVAKNILDLAIGGITLTLPRSRIVDFTTRIRTEPYTILYSLYDDPWMSWKNILLPFKVYIWITLVATVLLISSLLFLNVRKLYDGIHFLFFIEGWFRLLLEQSIPTIHPSIKSRWSIMLLMFLWFLFALIINSSYKSKLTSYLINSKAKEYNTFDDLVDEDFYFEMNDFDSTVLQENLKLSADAKFLETLRRSTNTTPYCNALLKIATQKKALIDEQLLMQHMIQEKCRSDLSITILDNLRLLRDDLFPSTHAWPLQLNSPYRLKFNHIILRLQATGLFVKWASDYIPQSKVIPRSHQRVARLRAPSFNLTSMLGPVLVWMVGLGVATLLFIGERIRGR